jgi:Domain of unknown function (DUF4145)
VAKQVITPDLREAADEVRLTGNDVAHPARLGTITPKYAEEALSSSEASWRPRWPSPVGWHSEELRSHRRIPRTPRLVRPSG